MYQIQFLKINKHVCILPVTKKSASSGRSSTCASVHWPRSRARARCPTSAYPVTSHSPRLTAPLIVTIARIKGKNYFIFS